MKKLSPFFIGSYTQKLPQAPNGHGEGICGALLDTETGMITITGSYRKCHNPSWLTVVGNTLFAVEEKSDRSGSLLRLTTNRTEINGILSRYDLEGGAGCYLSVLGNTIFVASYLDGLLEVFDYQNGGLSQRDVIRYSGSGPNQKRQLSPHAHQAVPSPDGRHLYVCDLGSDTIWLHTITASISEQQVAVKLPDGSGPRHLCFHADGKTVYLINELSAKVWVLTRKCDSGVLHPIQEINSLPSDYTGEPLAAAIKISPSSKALYVSNRLCNTITCFCVAPDGQLRLHNSFACGGECPRDIAIDPSGQWLIVANQDSDKLAVFQTQPDTGLPCDTKPVYTFKCATPTCVSFQ